MKDCLSPIITIEDNKDKNESSTPEVPKSSSYKGKSRKPQHKKKNKGGKMVAVVSSYTGSIEELKAHMFTTGSTRNKTFLLNREKFLGYDTTKSKCKTRSNTVSRYGTLSTGYCTKL